ncbi:MAG: hypothetical protein ACO4AU_05650 [bacterium]|jgi:hypothetical protein
MARKNNLDVIINSLERKPDEWRVDEFWARHQSGVTLWIGNGFLGYHVEKPEYQEFGLLERIRLHKAVKALLDLKQAQGPFQ